MLYLPQCLSCTTSQLSLDGWGAALRRQKWIVAAPKSSSVLSTVMGSPVTYDLLRTGSDAPTVNGVAIDQLILVDFDSRSVIVRVESSPEAIARRLQ
jgi:hypothetical protein